MPRGTAKSDAERFRGMQKYFGSDFEKLPPDDRAVFLSVKASSEAHWAAVAAKKARNAEQKARKAELKAGKKRATASHEDYESDDGFVANGSDAEGPKSKKAKTKDTKSAKAKGTKKDKGEVPTWEISDRRRVTVDVFNGKTMVNIREFYEKDGEMLPGKKGISLLVPQFNEIISILPEVEAALVAKGEHVERPIYGEKPATHAGAVEEETKGEDEGGKTKPKKSNIEETSDEEE